MPLIRLLLAGVLLAGRAAAAPSCSVTATNVAFGTYNPANPALAYTGTLRVLCSSGPTTFTIALGAGSSGTILARTMKNGAATLAYQLYTDAAHTRIWGNGTAGVVVGPFTTGSGAFVGAFTVYGLLRPGQNTPAGLYVDTVVAQVIYR
jgi:spore coat protein U-like protein